MNSMLWLLFLAFALRCESLKVAPLAEEVEEEEVPLAEDAEEVEPTTVKPTSKPAAVLATLKTQPVVVSSKNLGNFGNPMKVKNDILLKMKLLRKPPFLPNILPVLKNKIAASERSGKIEEQDSTPSTPSPTSAPSLNLTLFPTGAYYFQKSIRLNWFEAGDWCRRQGMDLATITTQEENTYIVDKLMSIYAEAKEPKSTDAFFWFGLNSLATQKSFTWVSNGEVLGNFRFWSPNQPDFGSEFCGEYMYRDAEKPMWNDRTCTARGRFICEARVATACNKASAK